MSIVVFYIYKNNIEFFNDQYLPWHYKSGMSEILLISLGGVYWKYEHKIDGFVNNKGLLILCVLYLIVCFANHDNIAVNNGPLTLQSIFVIVIGVYCFIRLCKLLPDNKFLNYWGLHSISLYFFCGSCPNTVYVFLSKFMEESALMAVCIYIISLPTVMLVAFLLNKYLPWVYDMRLIRKK